MARKKRIVSKVLGKGRPPSASAKQPKTLSKKATQAIVRTTHLLNKQIKMADSQGDEEEVKMLKQRMDELGGLKAYQQASIQGQSKERGGDSSEVLMEWLKDIKPTLASQQPKLRLLEIGALSTGNACSKSGLFNIERIDLYAQQDGIIEQDFMERPLPKFGKEQFDIISLSLVLNFLPTAGDRGDMLKRTCQFLDQRAPRAMSKDLKDRFPALFLVLPAACIMNSRYMNEERLTLIMASLGYVMLKCKETAKLIYYLWVLRDKPEPEKFAKTEVNPGGGRNNFSVALT